MALAGSVRDGYIGIMNFAKQYKISKGLFLLSLLGLGLFLSIWLKTVYSDKVSELYTKVTSIWIKTLQTNMQSDIELTIKTQLPNLNDRRVDTSSMSWTTSKAMPNILTRVEKHADSIHSDISTNKQSSFSKIQYLSIEHSDVEISINTSDTGELSPQNLTQQAKSLDSIKNTLEQSLKNSFDNMFGDFSVVKKQINKELQDQNILIQVAFKTTTDSAKIATIPSEQIYKKPFSEEFYYLELDAYIVYTLKKMWFEFLMAFLLLTTITTAFYYILYSLKKQNELVAIKNDLISNITHELRTPIFTVSAALEALQSFNALQDPAKTKEYLDISQNELKRLSILVEKVLKTSIFEQPVANLNLESVNLESLLNTIITSLQFLLEKYNASLVFDCLSAQPIATIDKIHLTNVIYNLIDNALKYNNKRPKLRIELEDIGDNIQLKIEDNGIGIAPQYLDKVFDKFFRVPTGNQHNVKGYGLGLNYVTGVIQQHNGQLKVESVLEKGTTFIITIPKQA